MNEVKNGVTVEEIENTLRKWRECYFACKMGPTNYTESEKLRYRLLEAENSLLIVTGKILGEL